MWSMERGSTNLRSEWRILELGGYLSPKVYWLGLTGIGDIIFSLFFQTWNTLPGLLFMQLSVGYVCCIYGDGEVAGTARRRRY